MAPADGTSWSWFSDLSELQKSESLSGSALRAHRDQGVGLPPNALRLHVQKAGLSLGKTFVQFQRKNIVPKMRKQNVVCCIGKNWSSVFVCFRLLLNLPAFKQVFKSWKVRENFLNKILLEPSANTYVLKFKKDPFKLSRKLIYYFTLMYFITLLYFCYWFCDCARSDSLGSWT